MRRSGYPAQSDMDVLCKPKSRIEAKCTPLMDSRLGEIYVALDGDTVYLDDVKVFGGGRKKDLASPLARRGGVAKSRHGRRDGAKPSEERAKPSVEREKREPAVELTEMAAMLAAEADLLLA